MEEALTHTARFQHYRMDIQEAQAIPLISVQEASFERLFTTHFKRLYAYALTIVKDGIMAEEIVQQVFFKIWEKKGRVDIHSSLEAYLYRSVYHESLNYLKHQKVRSAYQSYATHRGGEHAGSASSKLQLSELQQKLDKALSELPEQCRTIFQMSRFEELKYQEIADKLGLSIKTVENQMGKALRILRTKLADYLPLLMMMILTETLQLTENLNPEQFVNL